MRTASLLSVIVAGMFAVPVAAGAQQTPKAGLAVSFGAPIRPQPKHRGFTFERHPALKQATKPRDEDGPVDCRMVRHVDPAFRSNMPIVAPPAHVHHTLRVIVAPPCEVATSRR